MTLVDVRQFIRDRLEGLGFEKWDLRAFEDALVPETRLEKAYHLSSPSGTGVQLNQNDQVIDFEQHIQIFRKGFNDPATAVDTIVEDIEAVIEDLLAPAQRLSFLNVKLGGFTIEPLNSDNDNSVKATLNFNVRITLGL